MIDHEKLQLAYGLCNLLLHNIKNDRIGTGECGIELCVGFQHGLNNLKPFSIKIYAMPLSEQIFEFDYIDDLIAKLADLTQPKPKYEVGQEVWKPNVKHEPWSYIITAIDDDLGYYLNDQSDWYSEDELHPSKQSLIEAQIEYWQKLKIDEISSSKTCPRCGMQRLKDDACWSRECDFNSMVNEKCEHEPEMDFGKDSRPRFEKASNPKCRHCGELYSTECDHEPEMDPNEDCRSRFEKGFRNPKCKLCGEFYSIECQHESDGFEYNRMGTPSFISSIVNNYKCKLCGEFYR